ncbi:hypothetical protein ES703_33514 [subsurface metagenome]
MAVINSTTRTTRPKMTTFRLKNTLTKRFNPLTRGAISSKRNTLISFGSAIIIYALLSESHPGVKPTVGNINKEVGQYDHY